MDRSRISPAMLTFALLLGLPTACARSASQEGSPPPSLPATSPAPAPTPTMTLGQMQERLLSYADSLRAPSDVQPQVFASVLGVSWTPISPGLAGGEAKNQPLVGNYKFYASFSSLSSAKSFPIHEVLFFPASGESLTKAKSPPCIWSAEHASKQLDAIGYKRLGDRKDGVFQQGWRRQHWRPIGDGKQGFSATLLIYHAGAEQTAESCVYGIRFSGGDA